MPELATGRPLLEELAALEHRQWVEWSKSLAETEELSDERLDRWEDYWVDYDELDEDAKCSDRKWAKKVIFLLDAHPDVEVSDDSVDHIFEKNPEVLEFREQLSEE